MHKKNQYSFYIRGKTVQQTSYTYQFDTYVIVNNNYLKYAARPMSIPTIKLFSETNHYVSKKYSKKTVEFAQNILNS